MSLCIPVAKFFSYAVTLYLFLVVVLQDVTKVVNVSSRLIWEMLISLSFFLCQENFCVFLCLIGLALGVVLSVHLISLYKERVVFSLHIIICWELASKMLLKCNIMSATVANWMDSSSIQRSFKFK